MALSMEVPDNITILSASNTNTNLAIVATLAAVAAKTMYILGFDVTGTGATAATMVNVTVTGTTVTMNYALCVPAGVNVDLGLSRLYVRFPQALPASAANTAIAVNVPTFGAGNLQSAVTVYGYAK